MEPGVVAVTCPDAQSRTPDKAGGCAAAHRATGAPSAHNTAVPTRESGRLGVRRREQAALRSTDYVKVIITAGSDCSPISPAASPGTACRENRRGTTGYAGTPRLRIAHNGPA